MPPEIVAIFGPTAVGKTGVAIALAELLRERGEDPVAVNCDSIQVYRGLEVLSGAASAAERERLEHRLLSFVDPSEEFSAGRYAELAHAEVDSLLDEGRRPIVVGGTGLYLRAALADLDLRPPVAPEVRQAVEEELRERGPEALHAELDPGSAAGVDPGDRKRIARLTELERSGIAPHSGGEGMWTAELRRPARLFGLTMDREALAERIDRRVDAMLAAGAAEEARAAAEAGASRTARAALGFAQMLEGDGAVEAIKSAHRRYARRQLTWMRRMEGVTMLERGERDDAAVAAEIAAMLDPSDPIAVVKRIFDWFERIPFALLREIVVGEDTFKRVERRLAEAGHPLTYEIDEGIEVHTEGLGGMRESPSFTGREGWVRFWRTWFEPWEDYELHPSAWARIGPFVLVDVVNIATGAGSGVHVERLVVQVWEVVDGRIVSVDGCDTREEALASIGAH